MSNNALIISIDDMVDVARYRTAFGIELHTPNIDRLMARGTTYDNAMTPTPVCSPARTAMLTSRSQYETGVMDNDTKVQDVVPVTDTLIGQAHTDGYFTWSQGKILHTPLNAGTMAYLSPVLDYQGGRDGDAGIRPGDTTDIGDLLDVTPIAIDESEMEDTVTANAAMQFLTDYDGDAPFFMMAGIYKPHTVWKTPQKYYDLYPTANIELPEIEGVAYDDLPAFFRNVIGQVDYSETFTREYWLELIQAYLAALSYADAQVGTILDGMDAGGHWDDTTVILFSDHGYHLGDRDLWHKFTLWEEAASIPLIIADPARAAGVTDSTPASLLDIWPTLSALNGLTAPARTNGVDLTSDHGREAVLTTIYGSMSIRTETWRYTLYQSGEEELFHDNDIVHAAPIANVDPAVVAGLRQLMVAAMGEQYGVTVSDIGETHRGGDGDETFILIGDGKAFGGGGDDVFYVTTGSIAKGGGGHDTVVVSTDSYQLHRSVEDAVVAWRAGSAVRGNDLDNTLTGSKEQDALYGLSGDDTLAGGNSADLLKGGQGADHLAGDAGTDTLIGGAGNDTLLGNSGADTLMGGRGHDVLRGGGGNDVLSGGRGRDTLEGSAGDDTLKGGQGADTFVFETGGGDDVIADFNRGHDTLAITGNIESVAQIGDAVVIELRDGTITLENALLADVESGIWAG